MRRLTLIPFLCIPALAIAEPKHNYTPPAGYVPDAKTAIKIAEAVWIPIYGAKTLADERPFVAVRRGDVWYVHGTLPAKTPGGTAEAEIDSNRQDHPNQPWQVNGLTMRWSERPPVVRSRFPSLQPLRFDPRSLLVAVAHLVLVKPTALPENMTKSHQPKTATNSRILGGTMSAQFILASTGLALSFASPRAEAQIHEPYQVCVARYGQPLEKRDGASLKPQKIDRLVHFEKGAYTVTIGFIEDRAVSLVFSHTDGSPISPVAVIDLLSENSEDAGFMGRGRPTVAGQKFVRSDHKAAALWARIEGKLLIWDTAYERAERKAQKQKEHASGF